ncbi:MAG: hypothetical protein WDZ75_00035 [Candidatus Paceibacterota bacterium]
MIKKKETTKKKKSTKVSSPRVVAKKVKKKTSPKSQERKVVAKKKSPKRISKKPLVYAADWQVFYAVNGAVLRSMDDLYGELETMLEDEYLYHKNNGDHFTVWVREVLGDDMCSADLSKATTRKKARTTLKKHLKHYKV